MSIQFRKNTRSVVNTGVTTNDNFAFRKARAARQCQYEFGLAGVLIVDDPDDPYLGRHSAERLITLTDWWLNPMYMHANDVTPLTPMLR